MKVIDAKIDWQHEYSNAPKLKILVDEIPSISDAIWKKIENGLFPVYFSVQDGLLRHLHVGDGHGYYGRAFSLNLESGETVTLIGPYDGCAYSWHGRGMPEGMTAHIINHRMGFDRGYTFTACDVTLEIAQEAAKLAGAKLLKVIYLDDNGKREGCSWEVVRPDYPVNQIKIHMRDYLNYTRDWKPSEAKSKIAA